MPDSSSRFVTDQTALLVEIPEAAAAVGHWRARYDTSAGFGVLPHVTILFPFLDRAAITGDDRDELAALVAAEAAFTVTFGSIGIFPLDDPAPDILHLVPTPDDAFRRLTAAIAQRWPQCPPYGGTVTDPTPHLTVTETAPGPQIAAARREIERLLPITATVRRVTMITFDGSAWRAEMSFPLTGRHRAFDGPTTISG